MSVFEYLGNQWRLVHHVVQLSRGTYKNDVFLSEGHMEQKSCRDYLL